MQSVARCICSRDHIGYEVDKSTLPPPAIADSAQESRDCPDNAARTVVRCGFVPHQMASIMRNQHKVKPPYDIAASRQQLQGNTRRLFTTRRSVLKGVLRVIVVAALAWTECHAAAAEPAPFAFTSLDIQTGRGSHRFQVELAESAHQRMQGLQGRRSLDPQGGMLFVFETEAIASMWMKNTFIPLDMLFLAADGRIVAIAPNTQPMSLQPLQSPGPVKAVLELNGGTAERLGIEVDDRVIHPVLAAPAD